MALHGKQLNTLIFKRGRSKERVFEDFARPASGKKEQKHLLQKPS